MNSALQAQAILSTEQQSFIEFLVESQALSFGQFTLKSGRIAPYFINTGLFNDGAKIARLGEFYAKHIIDHFNPLPSLIFGPAYKGIPLAVATSAALHLKHAKQIAFAFDRKEEKEHGDRGKIVGKEIAPEDKIVVVEDVITAGTTLRTILPLLRDALQATVLGVVVAVDRCERGNSKISALQELQKQHALLISPIVNIHQIVECLSKPNRSKVLLSAAQLEQIRIYLEEYGA